MIGGKESFMSAVFDRERDAGADCSTVVDPAYWLGHCEGFRAFGPDGWVGTVMSVRTDSEERATSIVVRAGLFRSHRYVIGMDGVERIEPWREAVELYRDPRQNRHGEWLTGR